MPIKENGTGSFKIFPVLRFSVLFHLLLSLYLLYGINQGKGDDPGIN